MNIKQLHETANKLFSERSSLMSLWQEIADNFYPERADFTYQRVMGSEFASNLMSSYPVIVRRDLGNQLGSMLRPLGQQWFEMTLMDDEYVDTEGKQWLEMVTKRMRSVMYDRRSQFTRATKEGDHDFSCFGQCVLSVTPSKDATHLLYRSWHLKDCAWQENSDGQIGFFVRKWRSRARDLINLFPGRVDQKIVDKSTKEPFAEIKIYHIVCEADYYDENSKGRPYWSIYYDCENEKIIEAIPMFDFEYIIPRWQTVSGSQYAFSPATITALPDARLIQSMSLTLLEAGEKATNPPMVATVDAVKSDVSIYSGGITWVDREYDERLGDALRPLTQDYRGMPFGFDMQNDIRAIIRTAFYLDKLSLPINAPQMTAYEVGQRVSEYIRQAMPIFEPMEMAYNGQTCELTFQRMLRAGAFGSIQNMPRSLANKEYQFKFQSPLHEAVDMKKGQIFQQAQQLLAEAAAIDGGAAANVDIKIALRDSLEGIGVPARWMRSEQDVEQIEAQRQAEYAQQQQLANMAQSSQIAANLKQVSNG